MLDATTMAAAATAMAPSMRVAIACSGLGHVRRGIEAWAEDTARGLARRGVEVSVFGAAGEPPVQVLPCLRRTGQAAHWLARIFAPMGGWHYGMGSSYEVEQTSFAFSLWRRIRRDHDILHVQDPTLALMLERARRLGLSRPRVVFGNGVGVAETFLRRMSHLQLLTPTAVERWNARSDGGPVAHLVPYSVDLARFTPGDRQAARERLQLPAEGHIVLCCAAIHAYHKRLDHLIREMASLEEPPLLVIAGAREPGTDTILELGRRLLGDRVRFFVDLPRDAVPDLYRAADVFVLTSLFETFGLVLLEAMASGLPVVCNDTVDFRYVAGPAGRYCSMEAEGSLAAALHDMRRLHCRAPLARAARPHVEACFSEPAVTGQVLEMYRAVLGRGLSS